MRRLKIIFAITVLLVATSCEHEFDSNNIMSQVRIIMEWPDGALPYESVFTLESSFIQEYNTQEKYAFGTFNSNTTVVTMRKGVYTLLLDVSLYYPDGSVRTARNADYTQPNTTIKILEETEELRLKMSFMN